MKYLQTEGLRQDYTACRADPWWEGEAGEFLTEIKFTDDAKKAACDKAHRAYPYPKGFLYLSATWDGMNTGELGKRHLMARLAPEVREWAERSMLVDRERDHLYLSIIRRRASVCLYIFPHLTSGGRCVAEWPAEDLGDKWQPGPLGKIEMLGLHVDGDEVNS